MALRDGIRRFCELLDAISTTDAPQLPNARANSADLGRWLADTQRRVERAYFDYLEPHPPTSKWVAPLVEHDLVPRTARFLQHVINRYATFQAAGGAGAGSGAAARTGLLESDPLLQTLESGRVLALALVRAAETVLAAGTRSKPYDQLPEAVRRLVEQLGALPTLQALASTLRLVAAEAMPAVAATWAAAADASSATSSTPQAAPRPARSRQPRAGAASFPPVAAAATSPASPYYPPTCVLLMAAGKCLVNPCIAAAQVEAAGPGAAVAVASRRQLLCCKASGVLDALCAAVLASPLSADLPEAPAQDAKQAGSPRKFLQAQLHLYDYLYELVAFQLLSPTGPAVDMLGAPEVLQLRWAGLEQLAALATEEVAGGAGPPAPRWLLLHRGLVEHGNLGSDGSELSIGYTSTRVITAAMTILSSGAAAPAAGAAPSRQRFMALAAPIARAMCAEAEELASRSPPSPHAKGLVAGLVNLATSVDMAMDSAPEVEQLAAFPDALEVYGWVLCSLAAPRGAANAGTDQATKVVNQASELSKRAVWKVSPATRTDCARRLLPVGLLKILDSLLRSSRPGTGTSGALDPDALIAGCNLMEVLLLPTMRARLDMCRAGVPLPLRPKAQQRGAGTGAALSGGGGGGGGGAPLWHPQDELGMPVTLAKVARRSAAAAAAAVAVGPPRTGHLASMHSHATTLFKVLTGTKPPTSGLFALVADLPPPLDANVDPQQAAPAAQSLERVRVAVLEAIALCNRTLLQLLEVFCDSLAAYAASSEFVRASPSDARQIENWFVTIPVLLLPTIQSSAPEELLAAKPQRLLAALGRLLVSLAAAAFTATGGLPASAGAGPAWVVAVQGLETAVVVTLAGMANDPQLVSTVAGWLQGGPELDVEALAAAVGKWNPRGASIIAALQEAAASGSHEVLMAVAQDCMPYDLWTHLRAAAAAGGLGGAPLWPPRVLRLCGNPGCSNLGGGEVEADLKLLQCSGCRVLRYCCAGCQKEHWRQGHKAECAAVAAGRSVGASAAATPALPSCTVAVEAPGSNSNGASGSGAIAGGPPGGRWSLEELMAMRPRELKALLAERGVDCSDCLEKADLARRVLESC